MFQMDIPALSMAMANSQVRADASCQVLKLSMEQTEQVGEQMIKMMELSVNPELGSNLDVKL